MENFMTSEFIVMRKESICLFSRERRIPKITRYQIYYDGKGNEDEGCSLLYYSFSYNL